MQVSCGNCLRLISVLLVTIPISAMAGAQTTSRESVNSAGIEGDRLSVHPSISGDSALVAFASDSSNLVPSDTNILRDIFLRDRMAGVTVRISVAGSLQGNGDSDYPALSADGRFVAFDSLADNLVSGDTNLVGDIFIVDLAQPGGPSPIRVSVASDGTQGNQSSHIPAISGDGRFVAFQSNATNLVPGDTNAKQDIFVRDLTTGVTTRVSVSTSGLEANDDSQGACISISGVFVGFQSDASNLVASDLNARTDVFAHDRSSGITTLESRNTAGVQSDGDSGQPTLSSDGVWIAFHSGGSNMAQGATPNIHQVYLRNRLSGTTELVSKAVNGLPGAGDSKCPAIGDDGEEVAFISEAPDLVPGDSNLAWDAFLWDRSNQIRRVSVSSSGEQGDADSGGYAGHRWIAIGQGTCLIGAVTFRSDASNLVPGDTNGWSDVFIHTIDSFVRYCTAKTNSMGCLPSIGWNGIPSVTGPDNFFISASNVLNNKPGILIWSGMGNATPFGGGTLCLKAPIIRTAGQASGGNPPPADCSGIYSFHFSQQYMLLYSLGQGSTVFAQYWSRDPGFPAPNNIGLTDALQFTICP